MAPIKLTNVTRSATLLKKIVAKADLNLDGAVRANEVGRINVERNKKVGVGKNVKDPGAGPVLRSLVLFAQHKSGSTIKDINGAIDEVSTRLKALDKDGDGSISDAEQDRATTGAERTMLQFVALHSGDSIGDFPIPPAKEQWRPPFKYSGTPAEVCDSLLEAFNSRSNDGMWPKWATPGQSGKPARYVIDGGEADAMVAALGKLYPSRAKAVLVELSSRTQGQNYGCVSPSTDAQKKFQALATKLGAGKLPFKGPTGTPAVPSS